MSLYHSLFRRLLLGLMLFLFFATGCGLNQEKTGLVTVRVQADGGERQVQVPAGSTIQDALVAAGAVPGEMDLVEPPVYTVLTGDSSVHVVRVREEFVIEQVVIPYEEKILRNESLPAGQEFSLQAGQNGLQELTTRRVFEDGVESSSTIVKSVIVKEATPQITMVGVQKPFTPIPISGRLVYLVDGDAWMMEGSTGNRTPVVPTGDLDGRVFSLSPDGNWLLYTRRMRQGDGINTLWAARLDDPSGPGSLRVDLKVANVVHFAAWKPQSSYTLSYSTVEPRAAAPGWQANNDLGMLSLVGNGVIRLMPPELETNMGGNYGWWGMDLAWAPDGSRLAYARPDGIGFYGLGDGFLSPVLDLVPLQTGGDWAWVPGLAWGPDGKTIYTVVHAAAPGVASLEESPFFDLAAIPLEGGAPVSLVSRAGMFAYPLASPGETRQSGEFAYQLAYLQALNPNQSQTSRYTVMVMDRDGSNRRKLFPAEGLPGLDPQGKWGVWSPEPLDDSGGWGLAVIYAGNLWIVDANSGETWQVTGDGLLSRVDWK